MSFKLGYCEGLTISRGSAGELRAEPGVSRGEPIKRSFKLGYCEGLSINLVTGAANDIIVDYVGNMYNA